MTCDCNNGIRQYDTGPEHCTCELGQLRREANEDRRTERRITTAEVYGPGWEES